MNAVDLLTDLQPESLLALARDIDKVARLTPDDYERKFDSLWRNVESRAQGLADQVGSGAIGPGQFKFRLFTMLRRSFIDAYRYGLGSVGESTILTDGDMVIVRTYLSEDSRYLNAFTKEIRSGHVPHTPADRTISHELGEEVGHFTIKERTAMYTNAVRALYFQGQVARLPGGQIVNWRALDDPNTCKPCAAMESGNPWTVATLAGKVPGADVCEGLDRCRCTLEFR
jgi:hypothetical protein